MDVKGSFFLDVLLLAMGLHFTIYLMYGRIKHKALIGGYKPGAAGYDAFRKLVNNNRLLVISVVVTAFFIVNTALDARKILQGPPPHTILVVVPAIIVLMLLVLSFIIPAIFKSKR